MYDEEDILTTEVIRKPARERESKDKKDSVVKKGKYFIVQEA
tara:strand:+ start:465 stop:590 length:126 start_codon:yes stop_codon:yes gene_type:complete